MTCLSEPLQKSWNNRQGASHATIRPRIRDLAWAAGFLEGEGSFSAGKRTSTYVVASQVNREPLDKLRALFGGSMLFRHHRRRNPSWSPFYRWQVGGARAIGVILTLWPMLSQKRREQAREALNGYRPRRGLPGQWWDRARAMYEAGERTKTIASLIGTKSHNVSHYAKRHGWVRHARA